MRHTRRPTLAVILASAVLVVAGCSGSATSTTKPSSLVFPSFGSVYQTATNAAIVPCFQNATGIKAQVLVGQTPDWVAKVKADPSNPPVQVILGVGQSTYQTIDAGLVQKLDPTKIPNMAQIPDTFKTPFGGYAVSFDGGGVGIAYNKNAIPNPPSTWKEFIDNTIAGDYGNSVGLLGPTNSFWSELMFWYTDQVYGQTFDQNGINFAFSKIKAMLPHVRAYSESITDAGTLLTSGEVNIIPWLDGRAFAYIQGGASNIGFAHFQGGTIFVPVDLMLVKNASPFANDFINCALSTSVQDVFAKDFPGYSMTNPGVTYPAAAQGKLPSVNSLIYPPERQLGQMQPSLVQQWDQQVGG